MNERISVLFCKLQCIFTCIIIYITMKHYLCAIALRAVHLDKRCRSRHYDHCLAAEMLCSISHTLGMISGRCCDKSLCSLLFGKSRNLIVCSSHLVRTRSLQVLRLQIYPVPGLRAEIITVHQLRLKRHLMYYIVSLVKIFSCKHNLFSPYIESMFCILKQIRHECQG